MDELLECLAELVRTISRLHNNNKGLLLKGDIDRLERAKDILNKNANGDERGRVKPSDDARALPIPDVSQRSELLAFMNHLFENWQPRKHFTAEKIVDDYIKANCG